MAVPLFILLSFIHTFSKPQRREEKAVCISASKTSCVQDTLIKKDTTAFHNGEIVGLTIKGADLLVLSLWSIEGQFSLQSKEELVAIANGYKSENLNVLVAVAIKGSNQKSEFIMELYNQLNKGNDYEKAYKNAVTYISNKYPVLDFLHYFKKREL